MGRSKGSKNKAKAKAAPKAPEVSVEAPPAPTVDPSIGMGRQDTGSEDTGILGEERQAIYDEIAESQEEENVETEPLIETEDFSRDPLTGESVTPPAEEPMGEVIEEPEPEPEPIVAKEVTEDPPAEGLSESSSETEVKGEVESPEKAKAEKKDERTVSLNALHEEREKRKLAQKRIQELESAVETHKAQTSEVIDDFDKYKKDAIGEFETPEDVKTRETSVRLDRLEKENALRVKQQAEQDQRAVVVELDQQVTEVDKELAAEGLPGFAFLASKVSDEVMALISKDPDNEIFANPDGWKKIYREKVFPEFKGLLTQQDKASLLAKKTEKKAAANLAGSPGFAGKTPKDEKKEEGSTYEQYLAGRRADSAL